MIYIIIMAVIAILAVYLFNRNEKKQPEELDLPYVPTRKNRPIGTYQNEKVMIDLAGVHYRTDVFSELKEGDQLAVRFDTQNEHDKNAIGVYTKAGKLAGYIPRNQRKIIKTLRTNPNITALVIDKYKSNNYYKVTVELWVGSPVIGCE